MKRRKFISNIGLAGAAAFVPHLYTSANSLSAEIPLIDTHLHLWDRSQMDYPWLSGLLDRDFLPKDFHNASGGLPIAKMVFVECGRRPDQYMQEVDWVHAQTQLEPRLKGMVAYFPLEKGLAATGEMEKLAQKPLVRGIRRGISAALVEERSFLDGVRLMEQHGLSYDLNVTPIQLDAGLKLVHAFPNLPFIINHSGNPDIRSGEGLEHWECYMGKFAACENVFCKISGLITKADPESWTLADLSLYMDRVFNAFGPERVTFGSDWPVVLRAGALQQWVSVFLDYTQRLTVEEKNNVYYRNAERIYRI